MPIACRIEGAKDSEAEYSDQQWIATDQKFREVLIDFYDSGATVENIQEAVETALDDAGAGA